MARKSKLQEPGSAGAQGGDNGDAERNQGPSRRDLVGQIDPQQNATVGDISQAILDLLHWETQELRALKKTGAFEVDDLVRLEVVSKILKNIPDAPRSPSSASISSRGPDVASMSSDALESLLDASATK